MVGAWKTRRRREVVGVGLGSDGGRKQMPDQWACVVEEAVGLVGARKTRRRREVLGAGLGSDGLTISMTQNSSPRAPTGSGSSKSPSSNSPLGRGPSLPGEGAQTGHVAHAMPSERRHHEGGRAERRQHHENSDKASRHELVARSTPSRSMWPEGRNPVGHSSGQIKNARTVNCCFVVSKFENPVPPTEKMVIRAF